MRGHKRFGWYVLLAQRVKGLLALISQKHSLLKQVCVVHTNELVYR